MQARRETAVTYSEARLLVQALKRLELSEGETDESRLLIARFRRMRDEMRPADAPDDADTQADIFNAGAPSRSEAEASLREQSRELDAMAVAGWDTASIQMAILRRSGLDESGHERN